MAKVVVFHGLNTGLGALTVKAFRREDHASYDNASRDTQRNGVAETATEETNRKGTYYASSITNGAAGDLSGIHLVQLYDSDTNWLGDWYVNFSGVGTSAVPLIACSSMADLLLVAGSIQSSGDLYSSISSVATDVDTVVTQTTGSAIRAAIGMDDPDLDSQLASLPTTTYISMEFSALSSSISSSFSSLNDISQAEVNTQVDIALSDVGLTSVVTGRIDAAISTRASQVSLDTLDDYVDTEIADISSRIPTELVGGRMQAVLAATPPTSSEIADAIWDEEMSGHTTTGTYGGRIVRATNSNTTVQITGSSHVAADVHAFQADVIDSTALAASAVTEIQSGMATAADLTAVKAKTDNLPSSPAAVGSAMTLATDAVNSTSLASSATSEIATAILASGSIDGYTLEQTLKLCLSALAGKLSGVGTGTITIRSANDTANRIVATVDGTGNRTAITLTT